MEGAKVLEGRAQSLKNWNIFDKKKLGLILKKKKKKKVSTLVKDDGTKAFF